MSERFLAGGWRVPATCLLTFCMPAMGIVYLTWWSRFGGLRSALSLVTGLLFMAIGLVFAWGLLHRRRPVIELAHDVLEFGSIYGFAKRRRIAVSDIERVDLAGSRLDVTLRSGRVVPLRMPELPPERRRAARDAIERRIARD